MDGLQKEGRAYTGDSSVDLNSPGSLETASKKPLSHSQLPGGAVPCAVIHEPMETDFPCTLLSERTSSVVRKAMPASVSGKDSKQLGYHFFTECQALVRRFLHKLVPESAGLIPRMAHGAQHASRTVCWIPVLLEWRRLAGDPVAASFSKDHLEGLMKAALLHDSGREGEEEDLPQWEQHSGENTEDHLLAIGYDSILAAACRNAIINKNRTEKTGKPRTELLEKLLHDADCLEIMRCRGQFDIAYLDIYKDFQHDTGQIEKLVELTDQIRQIIHQQSDMLYSTEIINSTTGETLKPSLQKNYTVEGKAEHEFSNNALLHQIYYLKDKAPELYQLYAASAGSPPEYTSDPVKTAGLTDLPANLSICKNARGEAARHQVLMAQLAEVLFGVKVPELKLVEQRADESYLLTSKPDGSDPEITGKPVSPGDPAAKRAELYVIASVLGLWNVADAAVINEQGQLVIKDFSVCGQFIRGGSKINNTFGSTPFELEWLRNPGKKRESYPHCDGDMLDYFQGASGLFADLSENDIVRAVSTLCSRVEQKGAEIDRLIECFGSDLPFDRYFFRRAFYDRLSYMGRRYPSAFESAPDSTGAATATVLQVHGCEQQAIKASGSAGYCLPVSYDDIDKGELRLHQFIDTNQQPVTQAWLRLTPEATRRLSDSFGIPAPWHRRFEILNFYYNQALQQPLEMTSGVRAELAELRQCCDVWLKELTTEESRLQNEPLANERIKAARLGIESAQKELSQMLLKEDGTKISVQGNISFPESLPDGFPSRVLSTVLDKYDESDFQLKRHRYGRAWAIGEWRKVSANDQIFLQPRMPPATPAPIHHYRLPSPPWLANHETQVDCDLFADDLHNAFSFSGILRLSIKGQGREISQALVNYLDNLGIVLRRATPDEHQQHYCGELARCHNFEAEWEAELKAKSQGNGRPEVLLKNKLGQDALPQWVDHCRIINGRPIYFRPDFTGGAGIEPEQKGLKAVHGLNNGFFKEFTGNAERQKQAENALISIMHSGGSVDSFVERVRKGVDSPGFFWRTDDIKAGGAAKTCLTLTETTAKKLTIITAPLAMRRTDVVHYDHCVFGNAHPEFIRRKRIQAGSDRVGKNVRSYNETTVNGIALEEMEELTLNPAKRFCGFPELEAQVGRWPDGRPWQAVLPKETLQQQYDWLVGTDFVFSPMTKKVSYEVTKAIGIGQFGHFKAINPDLLHGKLSSLKGVTIPSQTRLECINMDGVDLAGSDLSGVIFDHCLFQNLDFTESNLTGCQFVGCRFRYVTIRPEQLLRTQHTSIYHPEEEGYLPFIDILTQWMAQSDLAPQEKIETVIKSGLTHGITLMPGELRQFCQNVNPERFSYWSNSWLAKQLMAPELVEFLPEQALEGIREYSDQEGSDFLRLLISALNNVQLAQLLKANPRSSEDYLDNLDGQIFEPGQSLQWFDENSLSIQNANLQEVTIQGNFRNSDFTGSCLHQTRFNNCDLECAKLNWAQIKEAHFSNYSIKDRRKLTSAIVEAERYLREGSEESLSERVQTVAKTGLLDYCLLNGPEFHKATALGFMPLYSALHPSMIEELNQHELTRLKTLLGTKNYETKEVIGLSENIISLISALDSPVELGKLLRQNKPFYERIPKNFSELTFRKATITPLVYIDFSHSKFVGCTFGLKKLYCCDFNHACFENNCFYHVDFINCNLNAACFQGSTLTGVKINKSNLDESIFSNVILREVDQSSETVTELLKRIPEGGDASARDIYNRALLLSNAGAVEDAMSLLLSSSILRSTSDKELQKCKYQLMVTWGRGRQVCEELENQQGWPGRFIDESDEQLRECYVDAALQAGVYRFLPAFWGGIGRSRKWNTLNILSDQGNSKAQQMLQRCQEVQEKINKFWEDRELGQAALLTSDDIVIRMMAFEQTIDEILKEFPDTI